MTFKKGDRVQFRKGRLPVAEYGFKKGDEIFTAKCVSESGKSIYLFTNEEAEKRCAGGGSTCPCRKHRWQEEDDDVYVIKNSSINMNLIERMAVALKGEPEKSFIKAGVMNVDESLTEEGQKVFMAWLLKKNGADFKKEVVDPILAEEEKNK